MAPYPANLSQSVSPNTGLVSIMNTNNEIGYAFDVHLIGKFCKNHGLLFHTDCVQAAGCRPINVQHIGCDFATISSHKIHGPKGVGALFVKDPNKWSAMILGGDSQEFGLRGGTENVAGIVGFGKACELAQNNLTMEARDILEDQKSVFLGVLDQKLGRAWSLNGCSNTATKTLSIKVDGVDAETLILMADNSGVCISAGSACNSRMNTPSHVLTAIGLTPDQARSSFRVSFSRMNTIEDVAKAAGIIADCIATLVGMREYGETQTE
jgi:cysteine desulfurase